MPAKGKHREPIIDAAIRHFRQGGYSATGLNDLVQSSGAPKGSLYHYFPQGKPSIAAAAVEEAARRMATTMRDIADQSDSPEEFVKALAETFGGWMRKSGFRDGCPITTVLLELAPNDRAVTKAGERSYTDRRRVISDILETAGYTETDASDLATLWLSALTGALIECRVSRSSRPLTRVAELLASQLPKPAR
ncbi:TetR/AcrR family transcriptional regulator [Erythrobacter sp. GH1-10]|uniref:TetR/AcrR family transcriptional regulator n=1 Tax=Erythrobacter sp. GH1-10 TaxID=3349334 RepID=UPI0038779523